MSRARLGRPFTHLWLAGGTSTLGTAITDVAVPLFAVLTFHASPFTVAALIAVEQLSWLLIGLPAGVWVDRWPRRAMLVTCDLGRAALVASIPVAALFDLLTIVHLFVVATLIGLLSVVFTIAQMAVVPSLVPIESLASANGRLSATVTGVDLAGRSAAGPLVQILGAPFAIVIDAVSFTISALLLRALPVRARARDEAPPRKRLVGEIGEGLRLTLGDPFFRTMTLTSAVSNFFAAGQYALTIVFLVTVLDVPSAGVGVLSALGGVGGVAGAAVADRLTERYGSGRVWRTALVGAAVLGLLVPVATPGGGLAWFALGGIGLSAGIAVASVISGSARQALCPPELIGRMSATSRVITWGVLPLGALAAGGLASAIGVRGALWLIACGFLAAPLLVQMSPLQRAQDLYAPRGVSEGV